MYDVCVYCSVLFLAGEFIPPEYIHVSETAPRCRSCFAPSEVSRQAACCVFAHPRRSRRRSVPRGDIGEKAWLASGQMPSVHAMLHAMPTTNPSSSPLAFRSLLAAGAGTSSLDPSLSTPPPQPQPRAPQRSSSLATAQPSASAAAAAAAAAPAATPPHRLAAFERELMMRYIDLPFHRMDPHGSGFVSSAPTGPSAASGSGSGSALMASWEKGVSGKRAGSAHGVPGFSAVDEDESESGVFSDKDFRNMSLKVRANQVRSRQVGSSLSQVSCFVSFSFFFGGGEKLRSCCCRRADRTHALVAERPSPLSSDAPCEVTFICTALVCLLYGLLRTSGGDICRRGPLDSSESGRRG